MGYPGDDRQDSHQATEHGAGSGLHIGDTEPRVAGMPLRWFKREGPPSDNRWVRHPVAWVRWRSAVRRDGPYAPGFEGFRKARAGSASRGRDRQD